MTQQTIIRSACYLCEGTIEFPAELANQVIPCPHCGKEIKLFAASKSLSRFGGLFAGRSWNKKQLFLTLFAVALLIGSLFNAPWEITYRKRDGASAQARIMKGTVFDSPVTWRIFSYPQEVIAHRLLVAPLALGWFGLLAVYLLLLFLARTHDMPLISTQSIERLKKEADAVVKGVERAALPIACISAGIGVLIGIGWFVHAWQEASERQRRAKEQREEQASLPKFEDALDKPPTFSIEEILGPDPASNRAELAPAKRDIFDEVADAQKTLVTGTWTWAAQGGATTALSRKTTLKLMADGERLTGTLTQSASGNGSVQPRATEIVDGRISGNQISFSIKREFNGNTFTTKYSGKVEGNTITGKIETPGRNGSDPLLRDWEAKRERYALPKWEDTFSSSSCCGKAAAAGGQCSHKCCVEAQLVRSICRKCNPVQFDPNDFTTEPPPQATTPGTKKVNPFGKFDTHTKQKPIGKGEFTDAEVFGRASAWESTKPEITPVRNFTLPFGANRYDPDSLANPYGAGSPYKSDGLMNPYSQYGSPYSSKSWRNSYATDTPQLYDSDGNYRGKLSSNPYDADSVSNPYGRYGSPYSPDSIRNPYGAGNPYLNSPIYVVPSR